MELTNFVVVIMGIAAFLLIKNNRVYHIHLEALDRIFAQGNVQQLLAKYDPAGKQFYHVFNPFIWTREQMFPGLWEEVK